MTTSLSTSQTTSAILECNRDTLKHEIQHLEPYELVEVYNILSEEGCKLSKNKNGVFINIKCITAPAMDRILAYINYRKQNKPLFQRELAEIEHMKDIVRKEEALDNSKFITYDRIEPKSTNTATNSATIEEAVCGYDDFVHKMATSAKAHNECKHRYGALKITAPKMDGVRARLLKKCKDIARPSTTVSNIANLRRTMQESGEKPNKDTDEDDEVEDDTFAG